MGSVYTPIDKVCDQMIRSRAKFWSVRDSDGNLLAANEDSGANIEDACQSLKDTISEFEGDYVKVRIQEKIANKNDAGEYETRKGTKPYDYRVRLEKQIPGQSQSGINGMNGGGVGLGMFDRLMDLQIKLEQERSAREKDKMEARIAELEKGGGGKSDYVNKLIEEIAKVAVNGLMSGGGFKAPAAALAENNTAGEAATESVPQDAAGVEKKLIEDMRTVSNFVGPDTVKFYAGLAKLTKEQPAEFKQQMQLIMSFANSGT